MTNTMEKPKRSLLRYVLAVLLIAVVALSTLTIVEKIAGKPRTTVHQTAFMIKKAFQESFKAEELSDEFWTSNKFNVNHLK